MLMHGIVKRSNIIAPAERSFKIKTWPLPKGHQISSVLAQRVQLSGTLVWLSLKQYKTEIARRGLMGHIVVSRKGGVYYISQKTNDLTLVCRDKISRLVAIDNNIFNSVRVVSLKIRPGNALSAVLTKENPHILLSLAAVFCCVILLSVSGIYFVDACLRCWRSSKTP